MTLGYWKGGYVTFINGTEIWSSCSGKTPQEFWSYRDAGAEYDMVYQKTGELWKIKDFSLSYLLFGIGICTERLEDNGA